MPRTVLILGGGVAGMTAAHELAERGYQVRLVERRPGIPGGKARTEPAVGSETPGRKPMPGEHGFRFFPGFYKHLPDTMKRIPFPGNANGVWDNLVDTETAIYAVVGHPWFETPVRFPESLHDIEIMFELPEHFEQIGLTANDVQFFARKLLQLATSCPERQIAEYDRISWWDFVEAEHRSPAYQLLMATGMTRNLVAAQAHVASTRTLGGVILRLMQAVSKPGGHADRVLNGPTNDTWLDPWYNHLTGALGVQWDFDAEVTAIDFDPSTAAVSGVQVTIGGTPQVLTADHYVAALPVEVLAPLVPAAMKTWDTVLRGLDTLANQVAWMVGVQYFLPYDVDLPKAHWNCLGTPWALTALEENPFWPWLDLADYGDGTTKALISVDISDWTAPGTPGGPAGGKAARDCTITEVVEETWHQLQIAMNTQGPILTTYSGYWLDSSVQPAPPGSPYALTNSEPLLVNEINAWPLRPNAYTRVDNFFLAGDYVRTNSDLATMEGANESARRAVNALLESDRYRGGKGLCEIFTFPGPALFEPFVERDRYRFHEGLPWAPAAEIPWEVATEVRGETNELVETGRRIARNLNPIRLLSRGRQLIDRIFGDDNDVEARAQAVMARNAARPIPVPEREWAGFQRWSDLLILHWPIDEAALRAFVPEPLEIDTFPGDGKAYVSLLPMLMAELALPVVEDVPGFDRFSELNFRTYVKYGGRRGVYFFRIDAPNALVDLAARIFFFTPYHYAEQTFTRHTSPDEIWFASHRRQPGPDATFVARYHGLGPVSFPTPGSKTEFLSERYSAFAVRLGRVYRGDLIHDPWPIRAASATIQVNTILSSYGLPLPPTPADMYYSDGVEAVVWSFEDVTL